MRERSRDETRARRRAFVITTFAGLAACDHRSTASPPDAGAPVRQTGGRMGPVLPPAPESVPVIAPGADANALLPTPAPGMRMGGGTQLAPPPRGTVRLTGTTATGGLTQDVAARVGHQGSGIVRSCYEAALRTTPSLSGTVEVSVQVNADGTVRATTLRHAALAPASPWMDSCVPSAVRRWMFPLPLPGGGAAVYTFEFAIPG